MERNSCFDNDEYWIYGRSILFHKTRMRTTFLEINKLIKLTGLEGNRSVLDLCCGIGRHSAELSRRGFAVTGVDITEDYLRTARENAVKENLAIDYQKADMRDFCQPDAFDLIINMFTSFGYFEDAQDDRKVLENAFVSLKENGKILIELLGKEVVATGFREKEWLEYDGYTVLAETKIIRDWSWIMCKWIIMKDDYKKEITYSHKLYSGTELKCLLEATGFRNVRLFGDMSGAPYDHNARILLIVGEK
jgi:SAM-dependent methyltransferase